MNNSPSPGQIIAMVSGGLLFIGSFLAWFTIDGFGVDVSYNVWEGDLGLFPAFVLPALVGLAAGILVALRTFGNATLPDEILGFSLVQLGMVAGVWSVLTCIGYLFLDFGGGSNGLGFWLSILAAIGLTAGSFMEQNESGGAPTGAGGPAPPQSF